MTIKYKENNCHIQGEIVVEAALLFDVPKGVSYIFRIFKLACWVDDYYEVL